MPIRFHHFSLPLFEDNYHLFLVPIVFLVFVLVKNDLWFDSRFPPAEDYELWDRVLQIAKGANIPVATIAPVGDGACGAFTMTFECRAHACCGECA